MVLCIIILHLNFFIIASNKLFTHQSNTRLSPMNVSDSSLFPLVLLLLINSFISVIYRNRIDQIGSDLIHLQRFCFHKIDSNSNLTFLSVNVSYKHLSIRTKEELLTARKRKCNECSKGSDDFAFKPS